MLSKEAFKCYCGDIMHTAKMYDKRSYYGTIMDIAYEHYKAGYLEYDTMDLCIIYAAKYIKGELKSHRDFIVKLLESYNNGKINMVDYTIIAEAYSIETAKVYLDYCLNNKAKWDRKIEVLHEHVLNGEHAKLLLDALDDGEFYDLYKEILKYIDDDEDYMCIVLNLYEIAKLKIISHFDTTMDDKLYIAKKFTCMSIGFFEDLEYILKNITTFENIRDYFIECDYKTMPHKIIPLRYGLDVNEFVEKGYENRVIRLIAQAKEYGLDYTQMVVENANKVNYIPFESIFEGLKEVKKINIDCGNLTREGIKPKKSWFFS